MSGNPFLEFLATARCRHSDPPVTPWCEWPVVPRPPRAWSVLAWHGKRRMCRGWTIHGVFTGDIPSGKHTKNYGKSPCFMGKITISMAIFNSELLNYQRVNGYHGRRNRKFRDMGMEWDLHSNLFEFAMENGPFVVMIYRRWWWPRKVDVLPVKNECFPYSFVVFSAHKNWDLVEIILYIYQLFGCEQQGTGWFVIHPHLPLKKEHQLGGDLSYPLICYCYIPCYITISYGFI